MRRGFWVSAITLAAVCGCALAAGGDMGVGTDPNTDGSETYPWLIEDLADFDEFAANSAYWAAGVHTKLMTDIDLDPNLPSRQVYTTAVIAPDLDNTNLYFDGIPYRGVFDGYGYSLTNIDIDAEFKDNNYLGLFGQIKGPQAEVKNFGIENISIDGANGSQYVGGLAGENRRGIVVNCYATGQVNGNGRVGGLVGYNCWGVMFNCHSSSTVSDNQTSLGGIYYGGLVGHNYFGLVANCYSTSTVNGASWSGGLIGDNQGNLMNCYSTGPVSGDDTVGAFVGEGFAGTVANCYSTGSVSGNSNVGGFVGSEPSLGGRVVNCFWDVEVSGFGSEGDDNYGAIGKTTLQLQSQSTFTDSGWDFIDETANGTCQIWQMPITTGYPILSSMNGYEPVALDGAGNSVDPYIISNASQLGAIYHYPPASCYRLTADIDLTGIQWSTAVIPVLYGSFEGADFSIDNLTIDGGGYLALFGFLAADEPVTDLGLEDISITGTGNFNGGLVGYNFSDNVLNCYTTGSISGDSSVGGLAGHNLGTVENCYSVCSVYGIDSEIGGLVGMNYSGSVEKCYSTGLVTGARYVGGLVGWNYYPATVSNSYATGSATCTGDYVGGVAGSNGSSFPTESVLINCYSTGSVTCAGEHVGGVMGNNSGTTTGCFWDVESSGFGNPEDNNFGAIGKTTLQMQTQSTLTGWDFVGESSNGINDIWRMCADGVDYPRLNWEFPVGDLTCPDGVGMEDMEILSQCWLAVMDLPTELDDDNDTIVGLSEMTRLGQYWLQTGCADCGGIDTTGEGDVDTEDLTEIIADWLRMVHPECIHCDINGDGDINIDDYSVLSQNWLFGL